MSQTVNMASPGAAIPVALPSRLGEEQAAWQVCDRVLKESLIPTAPPVPGEELKKRKVRELADKEARNNAIAIIAWLSTIAIGIAIICINAKCDFGQSQAVSGVLYGLGIALVAFPILGAMSACDEDD